MYVIHVGLCMTLWSNCSLVGVITVFSRVRCIKLPQQTLHVKWWLRCSTEGVALSCTDSLCDFNVSAFMNILRNLYTHTHCHQAWADNVSEQWHNAWEIEASENCEHRQKSIRELFLNSVSVQRRIASDECEMLLEINCCNCSHTWDVGKCWQCLKLLWRFKLCFAD